MTTRDQIEIRLAYLYRALAVANRHLERAKGQERASLLQKVIELEEEIKRGKALLSEARP